MIIKRGDIILANLEPVVGSEQGKVRPCLVIQNDIGNVTGTTIIVAAITSQTEHKYPFTVKLGRGEGNLTKDSLILLNQIRTISIEHRIISKIGVLSLGKMREVDEAIKVSLGLE